MNAFKTTSLITWLCILLLANSIDGLAQYFPNEDFELYSNCPTGNSQINFCNSWTNANSASTDYHNTCGYTGNGVIDGGPSSGNGSVGMWGYPAFSSCPGDAYAEMIKGTLMQSLVANTQYCITFDLRVDGTGSYTGPPNGCLDYGIYFYNTSSPPTPNGVCTFNVTPQLSINGNSILQGTYSTFSFTYTASGGENAAIIGPFKNGNTSGCNTSNRTYLNLDNLTMVACNNCTSPTLVIARVKQRFLLLGD
ncbi:MAG: hypothetical protein ACE5DN_06800 [Flavobacteriales bacterium]